MSDETQEFRTPTLSLSDEKSVDEGKETRSQIIPSYYLCSTDDSTRWLVVIVNGSGHMHLLGEGSREDMSRLRDMLNRERSESTWAG